MRVFQRMTSDLWLHGYAGPTYSTGERIEVLRVEQGQWMVMVGRSTTWHMLANGVSFHHALRVAHSYHQKCLTNFGLKVPA